VRTRTVLGAVAGLVVAAAVVAVAVPVVRGSDARTTDLRTAQDNPLPPETGPLPATVRALWTAPTGTAAAPVEGPSAIATGADRVAGLDPATGRERWSYRRGNARLCSATLRDSVVIALFAKEHGCRDLIGLDAATGDRRWYRTLEITTDAVLTSGPGVGVATAGEQMIAFDTGGGLNRWTWSAAGCRLDPAVAGRVAVVTVARCAGGETRLVVHSPYTDKAPWVRTEAAGADPRVLTADERVTVLSGQVLTTFSTAEDGDGKLTATEAGVTRDPRLAATGTPVAVAEGDFVVLWTGSTAVAVDTRNRVVLWAAAATGPPTLAEGQVLFAASDGFTSRPTATGTPVTAVSAGAAIPTGAALSRIGRLVVTAAAGHVTAYG
jgi:outer membrane protein assembly factor BamB